MLILCAQKFNHKNHCVFNFPYALAYLFKQSHCYDNAHIATSYILTLYGPLQAHVMMCLKLILLLGCSLRLLSMHTYICVRTHFISQLRVHILHTTVKASRPYLRIRRSSHRFLRLLILLLLLLLYCFIRISFSICKYTK